MLLLGLEFFLCIVDIRRGRPGQFFFFLQSQCLSGKFSLSSEDRSHSIHQVSFIVGKQPFMYICALTSFNQWANLSLDSSLTLSMLPKAQKQLLSDLPSWHSLLQYTGLLIVFTGHSWPGHTLICKNRQVERFIDIHWH